MMSLRVATACSAEASSGISTPAAKANAIQYLPTIASSPSFQPLSWRALARVLPLLAGELPTQVLADVDLDKAGQQALPHHLLERSVIASIGSRGQPHDTPQVQRLRR